MSTRRVEGVRASSDVALVFGRKNVYKMRVAHSAVQNAAINREKLTKNVAWLMQFHSGSSNMMPLRLH
jgi:hypothetical protein